MLKEKLQELMKTARPSRSRLTTEGAVDVWVPQAGFEAEFEQAAATAVSARMTFGTNNRLVVTPIPVKDAGEPYRILYGIERVYGGRQGTAWGQTEEQALALINSYEITKGALKWDRKKAPEAPPSSKQEPQEFVPFGW